MYEHIVNRDNKKLGYSEKVKISERFKYLFCFCQLNDLQDSYKYGGKESVHKHFNDKIAECEGDEYAEARAFNSCVLSDLLRVRHKEYRASEQKYARVDDRTKKRCDYCREEFELGLKKLEYESRYEATRRALEKDGNNGAGEAESEEKCRAARSKNDNSEHESEPSADERTAKTSTDRDRDKSDRGRERAEECCVGCKQLKDDNESRHHCAQNKLASALRVFGVFHKFLLAVVRHTAVQR